MLEGQADSVVHLMPVGHGVEMVRIQSGLFLSICKTPVIVSKAISALGCWRAIWTGRCDGGKLSSL